MDVKYLTFTLILLLFLNYSKETNKIYMDGCNRNGFSCFQYNSTQMLVILECDDLLTEQNIEISLYDFRAEPLMTHLIIHNCISVKLNMSCAAMPSRLEKLTIANVTELILLKSINQQNPREIIFQNISYIPEIPHHFFMHTVKRPLTICAQQEIKVLNITMRNVKIGVIRSGAFYHMTQILELKFSVCTIDYIESKAIDIRLSENGKFISKDTTFYYLERNAIHIFGMKILTADDDYSQIKGYNNNYICIVNP